MQIKILTYYDYASDTTYFMCIDFSRLHVSLLISSSYQKEISSTFMYDWKGSGIR